jgi:hypothetical protein
MTVRTGILPAVFALSVLYLPTDAAAGHGSSIAALGVTPTLTVELTASTVTVHGVTHRGTAVIFAVLRLPQQHWSAYARHEYVVTDDDGDGIVQVKNVYVSPQSIWSAIDLTSGTSVIATPPGYELRRIDLPGKGLKRGISGQLDRIAAGRGFLEGLVVRPGQGAWGFTVGDGGQHDADGHVDGHVEVDPAMMWPVGKSPAAPKHLLPHDTLVLIDPFTMQLFSTEVQP